MPTFEETVLIRTPKLFIRAKELGTPTELADHSGNGHDLPVSGAGLIFGQDSGVETDPEARSVYIPDGFANHVGEIEPLPVDLQFTGNFTIVCFVKHELSSGSRYICARGGVAGSTGTGLHFFTSGSGTRLLNGRIVTTDGVTNTSHSVTGTASHLNDVWNMHGFVRNGPVLRLYTNAALAGENAAASSDPLLFDVDEEFVLGSAGNNLAPHKGWLAEWIVCDFAWTQADMTEVYESAINSTQLNGYSNVISSAVLYSDVEPDPVSFPFRHNWDDDHIERLSFLTGVSTALKGYEQANAQRPKPRREIEITQVLKDDHERRMFRSKLNANQHRKWWWPILEDRERLSGVITAGTNVFALDTLYRDYEVGGHFGIRQLNDAGRILYWEESLITGLTDTQVTTATVTANEYTNAEAYPVRRVILSQSQSLRGHTDSVEETTITARLIAEDEKVEPHRIIPWTPTITYKSHEVFDPAQFQSNDWSELREYDVERTATTVDFETGSFTVESDSLAGVETLTYRMILEGKATHAALLGWWYARAGSLSYLWVPTMQRDFDVVDSGVSTITVSGHNYFDNFAGSEFRRDLAFVYHDNTLELRRIESVTLDGDDEVFDLEGTTPTLTNLRSLSYLLFCRLDNDTLEIARWTDTKARFSWRFREVLSSPD